MYENDNISTPKGPIFLLLVQTLWKNLMIFPKKN